MASQEQIPASLPDTQNADLLTQSQGLSSQQPTLITWGKLCSVRTSLQHLDLIENSYTLGRSNECDICLTNEQINGKWLSVISKVHFRIYRERHRNTNEMVVYLEDMSYNGTYVNQNLVGHGKRVIIGNNSEIALAKNNFTVYTFISMNIHEIACELPIELNQKYVISRKLGAGACGEVRLLFTKNDSRMFAIKIIQKNYFSTGNGNIFNNPVNIKNEVEILKKLRHPCIIHLEDIHDTPTTMYIILELMEGGELLDRIRKGRLSEFCAKLIFYQVVLAVYYLHKEGITHRDLKPDNILLKDHSDNPLVKVSDFGMSKFIDAHTMMKTFCGTPMYVAPEILTNHGRNPYTNQVDVWSLGVILYVCLSGTIPFQKNDVSLEEQIRCGMYKFRSSHFQHVSQDALKLIKRMMTVNPKERITVPQILLHPWLRDTHMRVIVNELIHPNNGKDMENDENLPPSNVPHKRPRLMI